MIRTILVVEDDVLVRAALDRALSQASFEVSTAANGQEGLDAAVKDHPDLIIADLIMPIMTGNEMLQKLRQDPWGREARIIILSADERNASLNEALKQGVTVYFAKSETTMEELVRQISALG